MSYVLDKHMFGYISRGGDKTSNFKKHSVAGENTRVRPARAILSLAEKIAFMSVNRNELVFWVHFVSRIYGVRNGIAAS